MIKSHVPWNSRNTCSCDGGKITCFTMRNGFEADWLRHSLQCRLLVNNKLHLFLAHPALCTTHKEKERDEPALYISFPWWSSCNLLFFTCWSLMASVHSCLLLFWAALRNRARRSTSTPFRQDIFAPFNREKNFSVFVESFLNEWTKNQELSVWATSTQKGLDLFRIIKILFFLCFGLLFRYWRVFEKFDYLTPIKFNKIYEIVLALIMTRKWSY